MTKFRTLEIAKKFYREAKGLRLKQPLKNQYDRALLSIVLNLAEGSAKPTAKDRKKFYSIALGSFREVQTIVELTDNWTLFQKSDVLGAHLYKLVKNT